MVTMGRAAAQAAAVFMARAPVQVEAVFTVKAIQVTREVTINNLAKAVSNNSSDIRATQNS